MKRAGEVRAELEAIFRSALTAVDAGERVRGALAREGDTLRIADVPLPAQARLVVLAVGKAAAAMAAALEEVAGPRIAAGLAITREGHGLPLRRVALREAGHPVPDARSERAAAEAIALVEAAAQDDVLVVLLSGGASSLLAGPAPGLSLDDLAATTAALLAVGCGIEELNAVRKHLSAVAGGQLARRARATRIEVLALSDVPGDRLDVIGSGPCAADPTTYADALRALARHGLRERVPERVLAHLDAGARGERAETLEPGHPSLARVRTTLLATNRTAVDAAGAAARRRGLGAVVASDVLAGEARHAGRRLAALVRAVKARDPLCLVFGGETTVTVRGTGRGGRSQELALAAAIELDGVAHGALLAAGTDGSDGPTDAAGAHADGGTLARARDLGLDAAAALADNDSYGFFAAEGGLFRTGPTRTNVMDLVLLHVNPRASGFLRPDCRISALRDARLARVSVAEEDFREALARWATGVTIVTSRAGERAHGMTVSAFTEVSLQPPLVLVCADKTSDTHGVIGESGVFAVNLLAQGQEALSNLFASKKDEHRRFEGLDYDTGKTGAPLLPGAIAHLDCRVVAAHDAGDHVIYVGRVEEARRADGEPLLHYARSYGAFAKT